MKFGKNLAHLSIPQWRVYNLDYNDLKHRIREVTQDPNADLRPLRSQFLSNFEYLDLFVLTKAGELTRKLHRHQLELESLQHGQLHTTAKLEQLHALHYKVINEVSVELRMLNKFILVQKIAVKKIFKKLVKYHPSKPAATAFVASLAQGFHENSSFMAFDNSALTASLQGLLADIEQAQKQAQDELRKPVFPQLRKNHSASTIKTRNSVFSACSSPDDVHLDVNMELTIDVAGRFDVISAVKKNFSLHSLVPNDVVSRNDLDLSINVYFDIPSVGAASKVSVVYLVADKEDANPTRILSYEDSPVSVVIAYTSGLRNVSYCCLPNSIVDAILKCLKEKEKGHERKNSKDKGSRKASEERAGSETKSPETKGPERKGSESQNRAKVDRYLEDASLSPMTRTTTNFLLASGARPTLRVVYTRTRYFLDKNGSRDDDVAVGDDRLSISPLSADIDRQSTSTGPQKTYQDNFYMFLDENIYTSPVVGTQVSFDTKDMDPFPFNSFGISSNDTALHNFESSLSTEIHDKAVQNKYRAITMRHLPVKLSSFLQSTSVHMFKNYSLYEYMRSCYFNVIPADPNNHYSRLLNVDLLKNYENVDLTTQQNKVDGSIVQDKSRIILNRQMSYKSLHGIQEAGESEEQDQGNQNEHQHQNQFFQIQNQFQNQYQNQNQYQHSHNFPDKKWLDLSNDDDSNVDSYLLYVATSSGLDNNMLNAIVVSMIRLKYRLTSLQGPALLSDRNSIYDSINDEESYLGSSNDYQLQLMGDYDVMLSMLYFVLCSSSLFVSGINIGILFSLLSIDFGDARFDILENPLVVVLLTFGFLFSLIFAMTSISLNYQRYRPSPPTHSGIVWSGFVVVVVTIMWTVINVVT